MLRIAKKQDTQKMLVKQLHKDLIKSKKKLEHNKYLNDYDKKNTLYFLQNVEKMGDVPRPSSSKSSETENVKILCNKILFYNEQYEIYSKYYMQIKQVNDISLKSYKSTLNSLVKHLRGKNRELKSSLYINKI